MVYIYIYIYIYTIYIPYIYHKSGLNIFTKQLLLSMGVNVRWVSVFGVLESNKKQNKNKLPLKKHPLWLLTDKFPEWGQKMTCHLIASISYETALKYAPTLPLTFRRQEAESVCWACVSLTHSGNKWKIRFLWQLYVSVRKSTSETWANENWVSRILLCGVV